MTLQNRVLPTAEIAAISARGTFMGNRGILHRPDKTLGKSRWRHKAWIICVLNFRDRHSDVMPDNRYTRLFFLDEAVALAAGHRPCAECRRADYIRFMTHWSEATQMPECRATDVDHKLHQERVNVPSRTQITSRIPLDDVPDGAFIKLIGDDTCYLVFEGGLYPYAQDRYAAPIERSSMIDVEVLTPLSTLKTLRNGYQPHVHESAHKHLSLGSSNDSGRIG